MEISENVQFIIKIVLIPIACSLENSFFKTHEDHLHILGMTLLVAARYYHSVSQHCWSLKNPVTFPSEK